MADLKLTPEEATLWHTWRRSGERVLMRISYDISEGTKLSTADFKVLGRLKDLGHGEMVQQDLASSMMWDKSRLSHHLTRMEGRGLTRRRKGAGKSVIVAITAAGREALEEAIPVHAQSVRRHLLWRLDTSQRRTLRTICALLQED